MSKEFVLVAGKDEHGVSGFHLAEVETGLDRPDDQVVLSEAVRQAEAAGYQKPYVCFDEREFHAVAEAGRTASRLLYARGRENDPDEGFSL